MTENRIPLLVIITLSTILVLLSFLPSMITADEKLQLTRIYNPLSPFTEKYTSDGEHFKAVIHSSPLTLPNGNPINTQIVQTEKGFELHNHSLETVFNLNGGYSAVSIIDGRTISVNPSLSTGTTPLETISVELTDSPLDGSTNNTIKVEYPYLTHYYIVTEGSINGYWEPKEKCNDNITINYHSIGTLKLNTYSGNNIEIYTPKMYDASTAIDDTLTAYPSLDAGVSRLSIATSCSNVIHGAGTNIDTASGYYSLGIYNVGAVYLGYRIIQVFDTTSIPGTPCATVTSATLTMHCQTRPASTFADVYPVTTSSTSVLVAADYNIGNWSLTPITIGIDIPAPPGLGYWDFGLTTTAINTSDVSIWGLRETFYDVNQNPCTNSIMSFASRNANLNLRPVLVVEYTINTPTIPVNFTATDDGGGWADLNWTSGTGIGTVYTMVRGSAYDYPATTASGYLLYYGTGTNVQDTHPCDNLKRFYYCAWSINACGTSSTHAAIYIHDDNNTYNEVITWWEGNMETFSFTFLAIAGIVIYYIWRRIVTGAFASILLFMLGAWFYQESESSLDIWHLTGMFILVVAMFFSWEIWTDMRTERKDEREENMTDSLEELEYDLADAIEQEDDKLARAIQAKIDAYKTHEDQFSITARADIDSRTLRGKIRKTRRDNYWKRFDEEGTIK